MDIQVALERAVELFRTELGNNLTGVYLHGSLAMGCYNLVQSDIDLLVIVKADVSLEIKKQLAQKLLMFQKQLPNQRGVEVSIILESYLHNFKYPTPFEFHYSDYHHERYESDENYICGGFEDPDLAAHVVITYHRGIALFGPPVQEIFQPIDMRYYKESIIYDIDNALQNIVESPAYYTLNLCRVLCFLKEGSITSKKEGGEWGLAALPAVYHPLIEHCLNAYTSGRDQEGLNSDDLIGYAEYMLGEIRKHV